jgi:hypothetical protein
MPTPARRLARPAAHLAVLSLLCLGALAATPAAAEPKGRLRVACDRLDRIGQLTQLAGAAPGGAFSRGAAAGGADVAAWQGRIAQIGADPAAPIGISLGPDGMTVRYRRLPDAPPATSLLPDADRPWGGDARLRRRASSDDEELVSEDDDGNVVMSKLRVGASPSTDLDTIAPGCSLDLDAELLPPLARLGFRSLSLHLDPAPGGTSTLRAVRSVPIEPPPPPQAYPAVIADQQAIVVVQLGMDLAELRAAMERLPELPGQAGAVLKGADRLPDAAFQDWGAGTTFALMLDPEIGPNFAMYAPSGAPGEQGSRGARRKAGRALRRLARAAAKERDGLQFERIDRFTLALPAPEPIRSFTIQVGEDAAVMANLPATAAALLARSGAPWLSDEEQAWAGAHHISVVSHGMEGPVASRPFRAGLRIEAEALVFDLWTTDGIFTPGPPVDPAAEGPLRGLLQKVKGAPPSPPLAQ